MALNGMIHHLCPYSKAYYHSHSDAGSTWPTELTFSDIELTDILKGQYSWVPRLMNTKMNPASYYTYGRQNDKYLINPSFWNNCLKGILHDNFTLLIASLKKSLEQSQEFEIEGNSILIDLNEFTITNFPINPKFYKVNSDFAEHIKAQELQIVKGIIQTSDFIKILIKDDKKKIEPTDFKCFTKHQCYVRFPSSYLEQKNDLSISKMIYFYFLSNKDIFDLLNNLET
jgi:hypothetical protein